MKVLITGASGMVGKGVLLACIDDPNIEKITLINRKSIHLKHPKVTEVLHQDFSNFSEIAAYFNGIDACFHCMGISANGISETKYHLITYTYTRALADICYESNSNMVFCYVSGAGTDSSEKGNVMWARVKGKTENYLLNKGFKQAYMFRPGIIKPLRGIKSKTAIYQFVYTWLGWLINIIKVINKNTITDTTAMGNAMISVAKTVEPKNILLNKDINKLSKSLAN